MTELVTSEPSATGKLCEPTFEPPHVRQTERPTANQNKANRIDLDTSQSTVIRPLDNQVASLLQIDPMYCSIGPLPSQHNQVALRSLKERILNANCLTPELGSMGYVFQLSDSIILKIKSATTDTIVVEHDNLVFIRSHLPDFPCPKPLGVIKVNNSFYMFTSRMEGSPLDKCWKELDSDDKVRIVEQLDNHMRHIRTLKRPAEMTTLGYLPAPDRISRCVDTRIVAACLSETSISEQHAFYDFVYPSKRSSQSRYERLKAISMLRTDYDIVFTHADLCPRNIMVAKDGDGKFQFVGLIDWEYSGFYPEWWEVVKALYCPEFEDWWMHLPKSIGRKRLLSVV